MPVFSHQQNDLEACAHQLDGNPQPEVSELTHHMINRNSCRTIVAAILTLIFVGQAQAVDYIKDVKPLLIEKCSSCHGALGQEAGLRLDGAVFIREGGDSGPVASVGEAATSLLIERVATEDEHSRMPPHGEGEPLNPAQVELLKKWIDAGMPAPEDEEILLSPEDHWAYQPIVRPEVPDVSAEFPIVQPVDAFIAAGYQKMNLHPLPATDRATLLRRLTIDLIGLPPTEEQLQQFLEDDSPTAYAETVERLLASPQYGERWGRHWMDIWRYSDWDGYGEEVRGSHRHIWRWRDWIIESLNEDKGYDQMVVEMLAGDELAPEDPDVLRATGYLARNYHFGNRELWMDATIEHTARGFLGITMSCARCHDHKFDPISHNEYYQFRAIFEPHRVRMDRLPGQANLSIDGLPRVYDAEPDVPTYLYKAGNEKQPDKENPKSPAVPHVIPVSMDVAPVELPLLAYAPALAEYQEQEDLAQEVHNLKLAEDAVLKLREEQAAKQAAAEEQSTAADVETEAGTSDSSESSEAPHYNRESYHLDLPELNLKVAEARLDQLKARWAADKAKHGVTDSSQAEALALEASQAEKLFDRLMAEIAALQKWHAWDNATLSEETDAAKKEAAIAQAKKELDDSMTALAQAIETEKTGEVSYKPVGPVYPQTSTGRRLALAKWITHQDHPLTARVAVNHVWLRHFGSALVPNVDDFGLRSPKPSHHQLLDWLAKELQDNNWSLKHIHRLIVNSQTYQLASSADPASLTSNLAIDPENEFYWKGNVQRLDAEVIRDSILLHAGMLDTKTGGPEIAFVEGETNYRRSLYFQHAYEKQMPMLVMFDSASPNECYRRSPSIVPQQALALANSELSVSASRRIARRLIDETGTADDPERFVQVAFERLLNRAPSGQEVHACLNFLASQEQALAQLVTSDQPIDAAAATVPAAEDLSLRTRENLVHVLINHNDFISLR